MSRRLFGIMFHDSRIEKLHFFLRSSSICSHDILINSSNTAIHRALGFVALGNTCPRHIPASWLDWTWELGVDGVSGNRTWIGAVGVFIGERLQHYHVKGVVGGMSCSTESSSYKE
jgi:hypothetical protein